MSAPLLRVEGLGKSWPVDASPRARASALLRALVGRPIARTPVLRDIGFEIRPGESLGIIGENGAGKSTLLKLIAGVLTPSEGRVQLNATVGALLELGAGFELERTGRENIGIAAGLMGWSRREIEARTPEIEAFADIGRYLDEPVKHYSSGMVVRLGFAIIATVRPQLLITDEVLAVGDESFQRKCIRWIEDYLEHGGTLLLVSHSTYHIQKLCKHALWLREGRVQAYGDVFDVTQDYLAYHERKSAAERGPELDAAYAGSEYRLVRVAINDSEDEGARLLAEGASLRVEAELHSPDGRSPQFSFGVIRADGTALYGQVAEIEGVRGEPLGGSRTRYALEIDPSALLPGSYVLRLHAMDPEGLRVFDTVERAFTLRGASRELGCVRLPHRWLQAGAQP
ncbi:ABC transporter ATP-binding protein [Aquimonas voraii]|uniref:Lipopolysaccharide transport system ATP-binding protein n=1 Tax=Aquimonas voraii TaxID=265719 RepID=A0A1G6ZEK1_9GAMM|nr:ABC transporter ATP-binding protein [Aquimonas voraii]SDE00723.1 lipopolysaccharide transport system ATP-binding protein [Aquimonas voraii]